MLFISKMMIFISTTVGTFHFRLILDNSEDFYSKICNITVLYFYPFIFLVVVIELVSFFISPLFLVFVSNNYTLLSPSSFVNLSINPNHFHQLFQYSFLNILDILNFLFFVCSFFASLNLWITSNISVSTLTSGMLAVITIMKLIFLLF